MADLQKRLGGANTYMVASKFENRANLVDETEQLS